jgi:adenine/guanine phosphoribosyltransferase-like PRPP-binding protein
MARHKPRWDHAMYLEDVIRTERLRRTVKKAVKILSRRRFDSIAFQGMSGALIAPVLAIALNKTMIMVRKEKSHSYRFVEGDEGARTYIIVDDFTASGRTIKNIYKRVSKFAPQASCIGVYFYRRSHQDGIVAYDSILEELRRA